MDPPPEKVVPSEIGTRAVQGKMVGFIRPPPDVRAIVDKTAAFVARMGDEVERKISAAEQANVKFTFLRPDDPYHSYYKHKVAEGRSGGAAAAAAPAPAAPAPVAASSAAVGGGSSSSSSSAAAAPAGAPAPSAAPPTAPAPAPEQRRAVALPNPLARALRAFDPLALPPRTEYTVPTPSYAAPLEAETVRLTAQFTAASGRPFLSALALREAANPAFAFLKPSHALFGFFTALVDAYARVLSPPPGTAARLAAAAAGAGGGAAVLERVVARVESAQRDAEAKAQLQAGIDAARALVDWHDFVVVETIEFPEEEGGEAEAAGVGGGAAAPAGAPAPARAGGGEEDMDMDDMEIEEGGGGGGWAAAAPFAAAAAGEDGERLNIRTDYVSGGGGGAPAYHFVHPVTGKTVPIDAASEHLRIELMDPKWREERDRAQAKFQTTNQLADGGDVAANLRRMAEKREDIFGVVEPAVAAPPSAGAAKRQKGGR